jgi:GIY-YIG catalytic domain-containing protein
MGEHFKLWSRLQPFQDQFLKSVPASEGVYIVHYRNKPYYAGFSNDLRRRLLEHLNRRGSTRILEGLKQGWQFTFTYAEIGSYQQAEAILLGNLGTVGLGNMRRETDPADKWEPRDMRVKHLRAAS